MPYSVSTVVEPECEPISLEEAKSHIRNPLNNEDANIQNIYIPTARKRIEAELGRQLITATLELSLDCFPGGVQPILIPRSPLIAINSITYVDSAGQEQTLAGENYVVDLRSEPGRVFPASGKVWPPTKSRVSGSTVQVNFDAGYGSDSSDVPPGLREAMLLLIGHYYYHREEVVMGVVPSVLPRAVTDLITSHSVGDEFTDYGA